MKRKLQEVGAGLLFIIAIVYIYGQFGSLEQDTISPLQFALRTSFGILILGLDTWFINRHWKEGEWM